MVDLSNWNKGREIRRKVKVTYAEQAQNRLSLNNYFGTARNLDLFGPKRNRNSRHGDMSQRIMQFY